MTQAGGRKEWFTPAEIAAARSPDLPGTVQSINRLADAQGWRADPARARRVKGPGRAAWEYHVSLLPPGAQARLALQHALPAKAAEDPVNDGSNALWARFERLSMKQKNECRRRVGVLALVERNEAAGHSRSASVALAACEAGVATRTLFGWLRDRAARQ